MQINFSSQKFNFFTWISEKTLDDVGSNLVLGFAVRDFWRTVALQYFQTKERSLKNRYTNQHFAGHSFDGE